MIYFIEHDTAGNICHVCADPNATMVPVVNRIFCRDTQGNPIKDAEGNILSPYGQPLVEPDEISEDDYNMLMSDGASNYTFDSATSKLVKKAGA